MVNGALVQHRFELIEGEWYFRDPVMALDDGAVQARAQALGAAAEQIDALIGEVESGAISPAEAVRRVTTIVSAVAPGSAPVGESPEDTEAVEPEEEPAEEEPSESAPRPPPRPSAQPAGGGIG
jgi:chemotaxis protein histidine kinase CheA